MTKKFISLIISFALLLSCIVLPSKETILGSTITTIDLTNGISGEAPDHSCIWYYAFNDTQHWQVCSICGATKNSTSHTLQGNGGSKTLCENGYFNNAYREVCSCGFKSKPQVVIHGRYENFANSQRLNYGNMLGVNLSDIRQITYAEFQSISYPSIGGQTYTWYDSDGDGYGWVFCGGPIIGDSYGTKGTIELIVGSEGDYGRHEAFDEYFALTRYIYSDSTPTRTEFISYLNTKINSSSYPTRHLLYGYNTKYSLNVTNTQFNKLVTEFKGYYTKTYTWGWATMLIRHDGHANSSGWLYSSANCYDSNNNHNVSVSDGIPTNCDICDSDINGNEYYEANTWYVCNRGVKLSNGETKTCGGHIVIGKGGIKLGTVYDTFEKKNDIVTRTNVNAIPESGFTATVSASSQVIPEADYTILTSYSYWGAVVFSNNKSGSELIKRTISCGVYYPLKDNKVPTAYGYTNNLTNNNNWKVIGNGSTSNLSNSVSITCTFNDIAQYTYNELYVQVFDENQTTVISQKNGLTKTPLQLISGDKTNQGSSTVWRATLDLSVECREPKNIYIQAIDSTGNKSDLIPLQIKYVDSNGPEIITTDIDTSWKQSKEVTITANDINNINLGLSKSDIVNVTNSTYNNARTYKFIGDVYSEKQFTVYAQDSVNNLSYKVIKINKIDNTKPRFLSMNVDYDNKKITYSADDKNTTLNANGSGVAGYRYIIDNNSNNYALDTSSGTLTTSTTITHDGTKPYLHIAVVDNAGNISASQTKLISRYTVTYDANGGSNAPSSQTKVHDVTLTLSNTKPTRTGYTFKGWSTSSSDTTVEYNSGSSYTTNANLNLYAVWKANEYKLEIDPNGLMAKVGTKTSLYSPSEDTGTPLIFDTSNWSKIDVATRTGYDLKGYYDSATGGNKVYNKDGNCVTSTYWNSNSKYKNPNNLRVYAQWIAKQDIHYEVNHYLMDVNGSTYTFKENVKYNNGTSDAEVTISNYKKVYDGFTYDGGYGDKVANASKPSTYSTTTTILQDGKRVINLYYTRNRYTLTVNPNGGVYEGSNIPKTYTMYYEETKELNDPTKENAKFIGWSVNGNASTCTSNGKAELGGGTSTFKMGLANTTLTAYWSELPVFSSTALQGVFYEGQDVTVDMLKKLVTVSDVDKTPTKYDASDITIESITYKEGSTRVDTSFDNEYNLDTSSERIGQIVVKYSVKDVIPNMGNITDKKYDIVTVYFDRTVELAYNDLPSIEIEPYMYVYNGDKSLDKDTIGAVVKDYVTVKDIQDDVTTDWWNNEFTKSELRKSIEIVGVSDIEVSSSYLKDNPDFVNVIKDINTLEGIYSLLETAPDGFKAITSYRVTLDVKDQWGKYASGKLSAYALDKGVKHNELRDKIQSDTDRTILVICTDDASYNNAYNGLRYVSTNYLGTLNANSYWGDIGYGNKELQAILKRGDQVHADNEIIPTNQSIGTYTKEDGSVVKLIINDYVSE